MSRATKKTISFQEKLRIYETLKENVEVLDDGFCRYIHPDINDKQLATTLDAERITEKHVSKIRMENFGRLRDHAKPNNSEVIERLLNTVGTLSAALAETTDKLNQLSAKHDKLCQSLSVNKVLDVRHLVVLDNAHPVGKPNGNGATQPHR